MKSAEDNKKAWSWIVDPIKSFQDGSDGQKNAELILAERWKKGPINDPVLWEAGKRAFDVIESYIEGPVTQEALDVYLEGIPYELALLWNKYEDILTVAISEGWVQLIPLGSEEPIKEFSPISIDPDGFWDCYKIEPYFMGLDEVFERTNILQGTEVWPYPRELTAAFFTLCHLGTTISSTVFDQPNAEAYTWSSYWFDRLYTYDRTKAAVEIHQDCLQILKSQAMNVKRHAPRNEALKMVTDDWSRRKSEFRSAEKAGVYYANWLDSKGFEYEPRTITTWIRKYAKDNGIKLR